LPTIKKSNTGQNVKTSIQEVMVANSIKEEFEPGIKLNQEAMSKALMSKALML